MKLNELIGYKSSDIYQTATRLFDPAAIDSATTASWVSTAHKRRIQFNEFTKFLRDHGFKSIGEGTFATVYEKSGYPWIFKLFNNDTAYMQYIKWVIRNQQNPSVPKVKGNLIKINDTTYAVRLEKLEPYPREKTSPNLKMLFSILTNMKNPKNIFTDHDNLEFLQLEYPDIVEILEALSKFKSVVMDVHEDNLMVRGNTPVLVDPVFDRLRM